MSFGVELLELEQESGVYALAPLIATDERGDIWIWFLKDNIEALSEAGHKVDFFTMYAFAGQKKNQYSILAEPMSDKLLRLKHKFSFLAIFNSLAKKRKKVGR